VTTTVPTVLTLDAASRATTRSYVRAQLRSRRWQSPVHGVVVRHNGPLSVEEWHRVALAAGPPGAVLGGLTAAAYDRLEGFPDEQTTIVVPGSSTTPHPLPDVRLHWSTELSTRDLHPIGDPARTRAARSLVDAASERGPLARSRAILLAGCQQGVTTPDRLADALSRRGPCRHRALIRESIADVRGGVDSLPEREFDRLWRQAGLPAPSAQRLLLRPDGKAYLDRCWDRYGVACEVHGIPHMHVGRWDADLLRQNEVAIVGPRLLQFTSFAIRHRGELVVDQLSRMLRSAGWRG
jgi:hypothetical protein